MEIPKVKRDLAISFIKYCIERFSSNDKSLYNILIFFLSEQKNSEELFEFLVKQELFLAEVLLFYNFYFY